MAEDGTINVSYRLKETASDDYLVRTQCNVVDSDGTLVLNVGVLDAGTLATVRFARNLSKPCLVIELDREPLGISVPHVLDWIRTLSMPKLNVAGPRESKRPGVYLATWEFLDALAAPG